MREPRQYPQRSIAALTAAAILCGGVSEVRAGRPLSAPLEGPIEGLVDGENASLLNRWMAPGQIPHKSKKRLWSFTAFRLAQVASSRAAAPAPTPKPGFRARPPAVREYAAIDQAKEAARIPPAFRKVGLDLRDRDPNERPSLLRPYAGRWLEDGGFAPIQAPIDPPIQPQVIPPPVPPVSPTEPEIPTTPATTEMPKPELFPSGESPTSIFPIPWETATGSGVSPLVRPAAPPPPVEPEPDEPEPLPNELPLRPTTSAWDFAELEGPLFGTEQIAEFTREVNAQGAWSVRPHFSTVALYDGNVFLSEEGQDSDFIITASPGVTARIGNAQTPLYLTADYTLGAIFFAENSDENSINHNGRLDLDWRGARTSVGFRFGVENDSGTSIDASDRVRRTSYRAGLLAHYTHSDKFSADLNADYRRSYFEDLIGSQDYGVQTYINYHLTPKVALGLGGGFTASEVATGRTQTSENISLRANWTATPKLSLDGTLGVGFYQFSDDQPDAVAPVASLRATYVATQKLTFSGDAGIGVTRFDSGGDSLTPTFNLDATWAMYEGTLLTFNAHSRVFNSVIFDDQNYTSTGIVLGLKQNLGIRFVGFVTAGYENLEYTAAGRNVQADRQDDYFFARVGLQWHAFQRCSFGLFYEFSQNLSSGQQARDFRRDRAGLQMSVAF